MPSKTRPTPLPACGTLMKPRCRPLWLLLLPRAHLVQPPTKCVLSRPPVARLVVGTRPRAPVLVQELVRVRVRVLEWATLWLYRRPKKLTPLTRRQVVMAMVMTARVTLIVRSSRQTNMLQIVVYLIEQLRLLWCKPLAHGVNSEVMEFSGCSRRL